MKRVYQSSRCSQQPVPRPPSDVGPRLLSAASPRHDDAITNRLYIRGLGAALLMRTRISAAAPCSVQHPTLVTVHGTTCPDSWHQTPCSRAGVAYGMCTNGIRSPSWPAWVRGTCTPSHCAQSAPMQHSCSRWREVQAIGDMVWGVCQRSDWMQREDGTALVVSLLLQPDCRPMACHEQLRAATRTS